jgi:hyperosmotically inducible periplasmic protein
MHSRQIARKLWALAGAGIVAAICAGCAPSEDDLKREVRARLDADATTAPLALSIEVKGRVVYLSGRTASLTEQQQAVKLARSVDRVGEVVNDMWLNNTTLADRVKEALAADATVGGIPIDVEAQGTLVRLSSDQTNREQRARAVQVAAAVDGVRQVEDRMK